MYLRSFSKCSLEAMCWVSASHNNPGLCWKCSHSKICSGFLLAVLDKVDGVVWRVCCLSRVVWGHLGWPVLTSELCVELNAAGRTAELLSLNDRSPFWQTQGSWNCCMDPCTYTTLFLTFKQQFNFSGEKMSLKFLGKTRSKPSENCRWKACIYAKWKHVASHWRKPIFSCQL